MRVSSAELSQAVDDLRSGILLTTEGRGTGQRGISDAIIFGACRLFPGLPAFMAFMAFMWLSRTGLRLAGWAWFGPTSHLAFELKEHHPLQ